MSTLLILGFFLCKGIVKLNLGKASIMFVTFYISMF